MVQVISVAASLRGFLILCAGFLLILVIRRLKRSQMQVLDSVFWLALALVFVAMAVAPQMAFALSEFFGFESPSNFVFLVVISILLMRNFSVTSQVAALRRKVNALSQELALRTLGSSNGSESSEGHATHS